jgi:hypothetical protein
MLDRQFYSHNRPSFPFFLTTYAKRLEPDGSLNPPNWQELVHESPNTCFAPAYFGSGTLGNG